MDKNALDISGPRDGGEYVLTPYCCDGHNDEWLVPGMNSPGTNEDGGNQLGPVELMVPGGPLTKWRTSMNEDGTFQLYGEASLGGGVGCLTAPYDDSPVVIVPEVDARGQRRNFKALPVLDGTWFMLQLVENPGVYLNVSGDGPYPLGTQILVYSSPGQPSGLSPGAQANQIWRFHVANPD